jgi:hypothetical protein
MNDTELREADAGDLAEQARFADESIDEAVIDTAEVSLECDPADYLEQRQSVPIDPEDRR